MLRLLAFVFLRATAFAKLALALSRYPEAGIIGGGDEHGDAKGVTLDPNDRGLRRVLLVDAASVIARRDNWDVVGGDPHTKELCSNL